MIKADRQISSLKRKNGTLTRVRYTFAHLNLPADPVLDDPGEAQCRVITLQDISLLEKMEQQVRETEKMAAIGELSAAIAHDFRNPLAAIFGSAQIMDVYREKDANKQQGQGAADADAADSTNRHLTKIILRESNRMEKTITDFLHFARPTPLTLEWFNLKRMIAETIRQIKSEKSRCQECAAIISPDIPEHLDCWADRQLLQIILIHLLENSCAASAQDSRPVIIRAKEEQREQQNCLCIAVIDKGYGIAKENREHIFMPFFSTSENSTGLGLAIVKQLTEQHNGTVTFIEPEDGQGCEMEICLPLPSFPED